MSDGTEPQAPWEMALSWCPPADSPLLDATSDSTPEGPVDSEQAAVTHRYNRIAWAYDYFNAPMEWAGMGKRRRRLLAHAEGAVLEVGVGTGRNIPHYPEGTHLVAIDASTGMLSRARRRAEASGRRVEFGVADVTNLPYPDNSFDSAVATSVFCSVAEPIAGLRELGRVTEPGGRILLIEHVRPRGRFLGLVADVMTSVSRRLFGFRLNRRTEQAIAAASLSIASIRREGIWREIIIDPPTRPLDSQDSQ